jgi:hypothetical protein
MTAPLALTLLSLALAAPGAAPRSGRAPAREPGAVAAPELTDAEVAARVDAYLGALDTPIPAERWRALGSRAVSPLEQVARSGDFPSRRAKAVAALSVLGGERARETVLDLARSEREPFAVRASALRGAARVLAARELPGALRPILERASEPSVRAVAADVLSRHAPGSACAAIRAQAAREADGRASFERALGRCGTLP